MHLEKDFDPRLDQRQLLNAAAEFRHDYRQEWGPVEDGFTIAGVADMLLGGTVYLINEEDEAEEYAYLYKEGTSRYQEMFSAPGKAKVGKEDLVALFDDQVHDSRAWFMNSDPSWDLVNHLQTISAFVWSTSTTNRASSCRFWLPPDEWWELALPWLVSV